MRQIFCFSIVMLAAITTGLSQNTEWVIHGEGNSGIEHKDITVDQAGNSYSTGHFEDTLVYKTTSGQDTLVDEGNGDAFVAKADPCGRLIWIRQFKSSSNVEPNSIALDSRGRVITAGEFASGTDFNPDPDFNVLRPNGAMAIYVSVLDNNGNFERVGRIGGSPGMYRPDVAVDEADNLYISGSFSGGTANESVNISPDPNTRHELTPQGNVDGFIIKVDPAGNFLLARHFKSSSPIYVYAIATGGGQVYATGRFYINADFEPGTGNHILAGGDSYDGFVVHLSNNDEVEQVHHIEGTSNIAGLSIEVGASGNAYSTGVFEGLLIAGNGNNRVDFDAGNNLNSYIARWDADGKLDWMGHLDGRNGDMGIVANDLFYNDEKIHFTGSLRGTADFDPGPGEELITAPQFGFHLISGKLDLSGNFLQASQYRVQTSKYDPNIAVTEGGSTYLAGSFQNRAVFNEGTNKEITIQSAGNNRDGFVQKNGDAHQRDLALGDDTTLCEGDSLLLQPDLKPNDEIRWNTGDTNPTLIINKSGTYSLTVNNCQNTYTDSIEVDYGPNPKVYIGPDTAFCDIVRYRIDPKTKHAEKYQWSTGDTTKTLFVKSEGQYSLRVETENSCSNADTVQIDKIQSPKALKKSDTTVCHDDQVVLDAGNPGSKYQWSTGDTSKKIKVNESGIYQVTIRNRFCTVRDSINVSILEKSDCLTRLYMPNAFSPNDDGLNETFGPEGQNIVAMELRIYDRWGEQVFKSQSLSNQWDGTLKGKPVPEGTYVYILYYWYYDWQTGVKTPESLKGTVQLVR